MRFSSLLVSQCLLPSVFGSLLQHTRDAECTNSPSIRACWSNGFDISTDYYETVPDTGVVREYWFNIENTTAAPDGVEMPVQLINGSFPGPTIIADWGDTVVVHLRNSLQSNGTGLHFHGIRQNWTSGMDGVPSITQCPIAPGDSYTYRWRAVQYGTGWYHSHFYVQAWDGETADKLVLQAATSGPPSAPNGLINGTNTWGEKGSRWSTAFSAGTRYRMRLVNAAADQHFRFMIDDHELEVIATDFVPIIPYNITQLSIGVGQRYDVIVTAKDLTTTTGAFWLRAITKSACSETDATDLVKGIIRYDGSTSSSVDPTTSPYSYTNSCDDETPSNLVPYVAINASATYASREDENVEVQVTENTLLWLMNKTSMHTEWEYPTLLQLADGNNTWTAKQRIIHLPGSSASEWVYLVIHSSFAQAHPMHLHGHDFWVLGAGNGMFDISMKDSLMLVNAPRTDVVMLPASGYVVVALRTDNPGAWLMHCHIAWHTSEGFSVQLLERADEIEFDYDALNSTCWNWRAYVAADDVMQYDSDV
ncbi:multicopper oxidase [Aspergillus undulatus]|uniref:multicopper oxidase n=1 Tax=Aspergillus undulatus TaxID=1810928 RepID=UPI003CCE3D0A